MFSFLNPQILIGGALVLSLATGGAYFKGRSDGYALGTATGVSATMDQLQERGQINEAVRKTGECDLILELNPDGLCIDSAD